MLSRSRVIYDVITGHFRIFFPRKSTKTRENVDVKLKPLAFKTKKFRAVLFETTFCTYETLELLQLLHCIKSCFKIITLTFFGFKSLIMIFWGLGPFGPQLLWWFQHNDKNGVLGVGWGVMALCLFSGVVSAQ